MPLSDVARPPAIDRVQGVEEDAGDGMPAGGFTFAGVRYHLSPQAPKDACSSPFFASYCREASLPREMASSDVVQDGAVRTVRLPDSAAREDDDWEDMARVARDIVGVAAACPLDDGEFATASRAGVREVPDATTRARWRALCAGKGPAATKLRFLAAQVNPNWLIGYLRNALHYGGAFLGASGASPCALNRNCVYCAKAVDLSLAGGNADASDPAGASLWFSPGTDQGSLAYLHGASGIAQGVFLLGAATSLTEALFKSVPPGSRAIVCLPVIGRAGVSHAVNAVHLADGSRYLVDGQRGRVYDVDLAEDREHVQAGFGVAGAQADLDVAVPVRYYVTGAAPCWTRSA